MAVSDASTRAPGLPGRALAFLAAVALAAVGAALPALVQVDPDTGDLVTFALLGAGAAIAQIKAIELDRNLGFPIAIAFVAAAALVLPIGLVALIGLAQHVPDIVRRSYPWYIQTFNTSNYTLNALAAAGVAHLVADLGSVDGPRWAVAGIAAAVVLVTLNHVLLATMLRLARGHSFRDSGLFSAESLSIDVVLALLGVALAGLPDANPAIVAGAIAPLLLVHRLFRVMAGDGVPVRAR